MIPSDIMNQTPMLASPCSTPADTCVDLSSKGAHLYDLKWDGVRCLAYVDEGSVTLRNRRGVEITARYPEIVAALQARFTTGSVVLDGELVCFGPDGRPEFSRVASRDQMSRPAAITRASKSSPATLMAFDCLFIDGVDLRSQPLHRRLELLPDLNEPLLQRSVSTMDGAALWGLVNSQALEGVIAKRLDSRYTGKRDAAWVKLKANRRLTALVTGWVPGDGGRTQQVGALVLSLLDDAGNPVKVGKVGTGFREADHAPLLAVLLAGEEFLVEIEFLEYTKAGHLRFPSFKGVRTDVGREAASLSQVFRH